MRQTLPRQDETRQVVPFCYHSSMHAPPGSTELTLPDLAGFDTWDNIRILQTLLGGQRRALDAVERALPAISKAADLVAERLNSGGRLFYAGAGTSIRVGVQDGTELPATFGLDEDKLVYLIAGNRAAMFATLADAEDDEEAGRIAADKCTGQDVMIAIAASGRTPYTIAAATAARTTGCAVIAVVNNKDSPLGKAADLEVLIESGPEVISGSTRLGAGTAQKVTLNLISTLAFTRMGAVHDGLMVNVQAGNTKLAQRARNIVIRIAGATEQDAAAALDMSGNAIKPAVLLCKGAADFAAAQKLLADTKGNLRLALSRLSTSV
jgi:N-acetylmuramic acid 6-phosphate etherase